MVAKRSKIADFLKEFKEIVVKDGLYVIPRKENQDALAALGMTRKNRESIILNLSVTDYSKGPDKDTDQEGHVWIFGVCVDGKELYIKLKIGVINATKIAKCLSFHVAQWPLKHPY